MPTYLVKQQFRFGGERFLVLDDKMTLAYQMRGSYFTLPKRFYIEDSQGKVLSQLVKKTISFRPRFELSMEDHDPMTLIKTFHLFRSTYQFDALGLRVESNLLNGYFKLFDKDGEVVAEIWKKRFRLLSTYQVTVHKETATLSALTMILVIDYMQFLKKLWS